MRVFGGRNGDGGTVPGEHVMIEARQVIKTYDTGTAKLQALKGVDFAVTRGEMVAVMGPSPKPGLGH